MSRKINLYYFGDTGIYDKYSPAYVCNKKFVPEILYKIAYNPPYSICKNKIIEELKLREKEFDDIIKSLELISTVDVKNDRYKLNFTVFLEKDIPVLEDSFLKTGKEIGNIIINNSREIYKKLQDIKSHDKFAIERLLYHIICDKVFDGEAFDYFSERNLFSPYKKQVGDRCYLIFGYEDSGILESFSNKILCSSNNYRTKSFVFNSFGDLDGQRRDMFRFFRMAQNSMENISDFKNLNLSYLNIIDDKNREIAEGCGELILKCINKDISYDKLSDQEKEFADFLIELGYLVNNNKLFCPVPVFESSDDTVIEEISNLILNSIFETVKKIFNDFEKNASDLTSIRHGVDMKETAIELWHQVFGRTNETLSEIGFVEKPVYKENQGRFLQSITVLK
ncbi:MAG: hypothetical protein WCQ54_13145 [Clostridiaceae bacterium]